MARASQDHVTRTKLLGATVGLMRRTGLAGAGINEIVRESGAPKGSVYHFFPGGKQQIVAEALDRYAVSVVAFIDDAMSGKRSPRAKVKSLFAAFAERVEQGSFRASCAAGAVCLDLDADSDELRPIVAAVLDRYVDAIAGHFQESDRRRARSFAGVLLSAIEGAYIRSRAARTAEPFREAGAWLATLAPASRHDRPKSPAPKSHASR